MCTVHATEPAEWVAPGAIGRLPAFRENSAVEGGAIDMPTSFLGALVTIEPTDDDLAGAASSLLPKSLDSRKAPSPKSAAKAEACSRRLPASGGDPMYAFSPMPRANAERPAPSVEGIAWQESPKAADVPGRDAAMVFERDALALEFVGVSVSILWKFVQSRAS